MRALVALSAAVLAAFARSALAQPAPQVILPWQPPPIIPADMVHYCIHDSRIYSIGAGLCFGRLGYVCVPSTGPATGNRAYWTSKDDAIFSRPLCN
jgi:hypothetical protein